MQKRIMSWLTHMRVLTQWLFCEPSCQDSQSGMLAGKCGFHHQPAVLDITSPDWNSSIIQKSSRFLYNARISNVMARSRQDLGSSRFGLIESPDLIWFDLKRWYQPYSRLMVLGGELHLISQYLIRFLYNASKNFVCNSQRWMEFWFKQIWSDRMPLVDYIG